MVSDSYCKESDTTERLTLIVLILMAKRDVNFKHFWSEVG